MRESMMGRGSAGVRGESGGGQRVRVREMMEVMWSNPGTDSALNDRSVSHSPQPAAHSPRPTDRVDRRAVPESPLDREPHVSAVETSPQRRRLVLQTSAVVSAPRPATANQTGTLLENCRRTTDTETQVVTWCQRSSSRTIQMETPVKKKRLHHRDERKLGFDPSLETIR